MAALPYMQLYIADYLADTMHLSTEEHGAYLLLMFNYWQTGKPIPKSRLAKIARMSNDRWSAVEVSLKEFFNDNGTEWYHERIENDLAAVYAAQKQRSDAGKASARKRKSNLKPAPAAPASKGLATTVEIPLEREQNETPTNKDKDKDLKDKRSPHSPPKGRAVKPKFDPLTAELPSWLPGELWRRWVEYRQQLKKPIVTPQGATGMLNKLEKLYQSGYSPEQVISQSIENEWRGLFKPKSEVNHVPGNGESLAEQQLRAGREEWLRERQEQYERSGYAGVATMGFDDQNLLEPLDYEEWQPAESAVGKPDGGDDT